MMTAVAKTLQDVLVPSLPDRQCGDESKESMDEALRACGLQR
ncbi:hypothetical protein [Glutamicibacter uratoxydans]